jgi:DNA-binding transcriptional regulator YiaG
VTCLQRRYDPSPARARAIREARDWAHLSQYDLARILGVSQRTVCAWEQAVRDPGPDMAARIAVAARVPVSSLLVPSRSPAALDEHDRERGYAA